MILSPRFEQALVYAAMIHSGQSRKASNVPYLAHLLSVTVRLDGSAPLCPRRGSHSLQARWQIRGKKNAFFLDVRRRRDKVDSDQGVRQIGSTAVAPAHQTN
jgi:hypothetical protein